MKESAQASEGVKKLAQVLREESVGVVGQAILPAAAFQAALWLWLCCLVGQAVSPVGPHGRQFFTPSQSQESK
jgi:hypothetical protein